MMRHGRRLKTTSTALQNTNSKHMKIQIHSILFALLTASAAIAEDTTTTKTTTTQPDGSQQTTVKTTTSSGTITEYEPGTTFIMKETSGPVTYRYGTKVNYITKSGKVISETDMKTRIRIGIPASVRYVTEGENRVISEIVIED